MSANVKRSSKLIHGKNLPLTSKQVGSHFALLGRDSKDSSPLSKAIRTHEKHYSLVWYILTRNIQYSKECKYLL